MQEDRAGDGVRMQEIFKKRAEELGATLSTSLPYHEVKLSPRQRKLHRSPRKLLPKLKKLKGFEDLPFKDLASLH